MKLYFGSNFDNEIEIEEFEVIKETEKDIIMKMDMLIR